ncbi:MAG: hypothetical protein B6D56_06945 [Candidatus Omnitrophica bacterium 4484_70.1]|nr:MAG: hypothetical protein B6D56_06945 [Candidatus Omnitrophica bacterium 4484_70.1]
MVKCEMIHKGKKYSNTVAKCLFVTVRIEIDNQYLFIVYRFRLRIGLVLGFVHRQLAQGDLVNTTL